MLDTDTFLVTLYTHVDDFCRQSLPPEPRHPGPTAALNRSEVVTLALVGQAARFASERDFWRFARNHLIHLFPTLPDRSQFVRLQRQHQPAILAFGLFLAQSLAQVEAPAYECLDRLGVATRWLGRRGVGWLPEYADCAPCARLGWFHGLSILTAVSNQGFITGFGIAPASVSDQPAAESFLFARHTHDARLSSAGRPLGGGFYVVDKGFTGAKWHARWREAFEAKIVCCPQKDNRGRQRWPKPWRVWLAGLRQIIESVHVKLLGFCRLERERPHDLAGFTARLSAKVGLHNFCCWINQQEQRPLLAFADLIDW